MKPARIILLVVALCAGGLAAFLVTRGGESPAPAATVEAQIKAEPKTQILVASRDIAVGERMNASAFSWQEWPEDALRPEYVDIAANPDATEKFAGALARFPFFSGEPILSKKLAFSSEGFLSALLSPGMRAVSLDVSATTGAGGFIVPNDRVDVVVTRSGTEVETSETVLYDVRVLAIGKELSQKPPEPVAEGQTDQSQGFSNQTIATLEVSPNDAETVLNATASGTVSLTLRSVADFNAPQDGRKIKRAITVVRFGRQQNVVAGQSGSSAQTGQDGSAVPLTETR